MRESITLFVYGTLMRGCSNHHALESAVFLRSASTKPEYRLYDCGSYPALVKAVPGEAIEGELYDVDQELLAILDQFEDVPNEYSRHPIELSCDTPAEAYFYNLRTAHLPPCGPNWKDVRSRN